MIIISHVSVLKFDFESISDCCDFTTCPYDAKSVFFKRLLTENPRDGAKNVLPIMEKNSNVLKTSLATLTQHLHLVFEAKNFQEISFYKIQKENSKSVSGGIFDTLYNVAKSTTASSASSYCKDQAEVIRCNPDEKLLELRLEKPWKFSNLVMSEVIVKIFVSVLTGIENFNRTKILDFS